MSHRPNPALFESECGLASDQAIIDEIVTVLSPYPSGRRRWAVMRAIRDQRERTAQDIPLKFEDEIERVFRRFCADFGDSKASRNGAGRVLFHRPRDRGGDVWALDREYAEAWLAHKAG